VNLIRPVLLSQLHMTCFSYDVENVCRVHYYKSFFGVQNCGCERVMSIFAWLLSSRVRRPRWPPLVRQESLCIMESLTAVRSFPKSLVVKAPGNSFVYPPWDTSSMWNLHPTVCGSTGDHNTGSGLVVCTFSRMPLTWAFEIGNRSATRVESKRDGQ
jgi:hypothetical protein